MKQFWARRNGRERLMIVLCVVVILVGGWLAFSPNGVSGGKLLPARQARQTYRDLQSQVGFLRDDTRALDARTAKLVYDDSPERLVPQIIRTLQDKARTAGLHLREIKPLRARKAGTLTRVPLSVRFSTTQFAPSVVRFLYDLEDPGGKLAIERYAVTASDPKTRTVDVEVQVVLFTRAAAADASQG